MGEVVILEILVLFTSFLHLSFFFFLNGCTLGIWKFLGQGMNLTTAVATPDPLTHLTDLGIKPAPLH